MQEAPACLFINIDVKELVMTKVNDIAVVYAGSFVAEAQAKASQVDSLIKAIDDMSPKVNDMNIEAFLTECAKVWKESGIIKDSTATTYKSQTKGVLEFAKTADNRKTLKEKAEKAGSLSQLYKAVRSGDEGKTEPSAKTQKEASTDVQKSEDMKQNKGAVSFKELINILKDKDTHDKATLLADILGSDSEAVALEILSLVQVSKAA